MRRKAGGDGDAGTDANAGTSTGAAALEIEFEDDEASPGFAASPAGRSRDLRPAALITLAVVTLAAAVYATHRPGSSGANSPTVTLSAPDYAAFVVTVSYQGSHLVSLPERRIEVDLRITPVPGAQVSILDYYVSENGVTSRAEPAQSMTPLPAGGTNVKLELTVTNCAVVPIGESMSFVDVVANGPVGVIDRFTILGDRYSGDLTRLLRTVCPSRADGENPLTSPGRTSGP
ncbi:MAG TPA: hypothetical protein VGS97_23940 [Actinocrinis sp.]|uniref:hypothetical protein n=1 Tax=Actinocrinis sp. TaxID=1920516 RepID=UPI002DDDAC98|nr:hypothetical protein [Actinocrinis sp.]HEV2347170.1 hypothetical protein [Actinocrinis sp.]